MRPDLPTPRIKTTEIVLIGLLVLMVTLWGAAELALSDLILEDCLARKTP